MTTPDAAFHEIVHAEDGRELHHAAVLEGRDGAGVESPETDASASRVDGNGAEVKNRGADSRDAPEDAESPTEHALPSIVDAFVRRHAVATCLALVAVGYAFGRLGQRSTR
jgi:hypothetical protein